jgi:hypothetical protein
MDENVSDESMLGLGIYGLLVVLSWGVLSILVVLG